MTSFQRINPEAANLLPDNPLQGMGGSRMTPPGSSDRGMCTLTFNGRTFAFRTNPNAVWWSYELLTHTENTYGGRVIQILGTRLGDLSVKIDCGNGGWDYLMSVVSYLRDLLVDQRGGNTATFEYTTRNWKLNVYALNIPFQDQVTATTREIEMVFKIQEDVTGILSQTSLNVELARLQDGVYRPDQNVHNKYNDYNATQDALSMVGKIGAMVGIGGLQPQYAQSSLVNTVDTTPQGNNPGGLSPFSWLSLIPGL